MSKKLAVSIGKKICEFRNLKGITLEKLAYENGWSKGSLSEIENGKKLPSLERLEKIAKALGVEIREFFT